LLALVEALLRIKEENKKLTNDQ